MRSRILMLVSVVFLLCLGCAAAAYVWWQAGIATALPHVPSINPYAVLVDSTPVTVTVAPGGERVEWRTTADDVRINPALWRRMHLANRNTGRAAPTRSA
jgi:hypothetical protein